MSPSSIWHSAVLTTTRYVARAWRPPRTTRAAGCRSGWARRTPRKTSGASRNLSRRMPERDVRTGGADLAKLAIKELPSFGRDVERELGGVLHRQLRASRSPSRAAGLRTGSGTRSGVLPTRSRSVEDVVGSAATQRVGIEPGQPEDALTISAESRASRKGKLPDDILDRGVRARGLEIAWLVDVVVRNAGDQAHPQVRQHPTKI